LIAVASVLQSQATQVIRAGYGIANFIGRTDGVWYAVWGHINEWDIPISSRDPGGFLSGAFVTVSVPVALSAPFPVLICYVNRQKK